MRNKIKKNNELNFKKSEIHFIKKLPLLDFENSILFYDRVLKKQNKKWIQLFKKSIKLTAGEDLKGIDSFSKYIKQSVIMSEGMDRSKLQIVTLGGGSVEDFAGFIASVLKRGCRLVHIPSTWLAAMDSAHGGKTALNIGRVKNQIGTFYPADRVYLVKEILYLKSLEKRKKEALLKEVAGEYYKTILLSGEGLWKKNIPKLKISRNLKLEDLWTDLPSLIQIKNKIVLKDPYEKKNIRQILNYGHTIGHVIETQLKIPHGIAVHYGLKFSYEWACYLNISKDFLCEINIFPTRNELKNLLKKIKNPRKFFLQDKKVTNDKKINFIFLKKPGVPIIKKMHIDDLMKEWKRQCK